MACEVITPEEADKNMESAVSRHLDRMSSVYKSSLSGIEKLAQKSDHTVGRLTGITYKMKTLEAVIKGCQKTSTAEINKILHDDKLSFTEKAREVSGHVRESFSTESLVAGGILATKLAIGTALVTASAAPSTAVLAGYIAYKCVKGPIEYCLGTHAGHGFESKIAKGIDGVMQDIRATLRGERPEYKEMHDISEKLDHAVHGHGHHHEALKDTLKKDLGNIKSTFLHPVDTLTKIVKSVGNDCAALYKHMTTPKEKPQAKIAARKEPLLLGPKKEPVALLVQDTRKKTTQMQLGS